MNNSELEGVVNKIHLAKQAVAQVGPFAEATINGLALETVNAVTLDRIERLKFRDHFYKTERSNRLLYRVEDIEGGYRLEGKFPYGHLRNWQPAEWIPMDRLDVQVIDGKPTGVSGAFLADWYVPLKFNWPGPQTAAHHQDKMLWLLEVLCRIADRYPLLDSGQARMTA